MQVSGHIHVTGEWRKLLYNLYSSPGHVARIGREKSVQSFGGEARRKETTRKTKA
jgi:hypothetical protein